MREPAQHRVGLRADDRDHRVGAGDVERRSGRRAARAPSRRASGAQSTSARRGEIGTRRCPSPSIGSPAGRSSSFVRCERSAIPTRGVLLLAGDRDGHEPAVALLEGRAEVALRALDRRLRDRVEAAVRRQPRRPRGTRGAHDFSFSPVGIVERTEVHGHRRRLARSPARRSGHRRRRARSGTIASPITLPSSALRRTLVTRPDETAVDDDLAALDRNRAGRALEADEHPLEAALGDLLGRPLADQVELLVVLHDPRHRRLEQVRLGVGVLADDHVALLEAEDPLRLEPERLRVEVGGLLEERVPHVLGVRAREVSS